MFSIISDYPLSHIIIGGDFNLALDPSMDRSSTTGTKLSANLLKQFMSDHGLIDIWRSHNAGVKEYSYYSPHHKSYSRIDFFLVNNSIAGKIIDPAIHNIIISAKAVMRGKIISYLSYKNKKEHKMEFELHKEVKRLEVLASHNP